jgi:hypothetical protein
MNELVQILKNTRQHLMTGVSHMIPFVVSGGILLAVSVMLYGKGAVPDAVADPNLKKLFDIGVAGLTLMVPFLAETHFALRRTGGNDGGKLHRCPASRRAADYCGDLPP